MSEYRIRLKAPKLIAWQYTTDRDFVPGWVRRATEYNPEGELILVRKSGRQVVNVGEWLVIDTDGDIVHLSDATVRADYEVWGK